MKSLVYEHSENIGKTYFYRCNLALAGTGEENAVKRMLVNKTLIENLPKLPFMLC